MEEKTKHLEFIQKVIERMAHNSFLLKGWAVTLVAGMLSLSVKESSDSYVIIAIGLTFFFWILDAYYLAQERRFRNLYESVCKKENSEIDFSMNTSEFKTCCEYTCAFWSHVPLLFYGALVIASAVILYLF